MYLFPILYFFNILFFSQRFSILITSGKSEGMTFKQAAKHTYSFHGHSAKCTVKNKKLKKKESRGKSL